MSKMSNMINQIQDLAYQGLPNVEIAKYTGMPPTFVDDVVKDFFEAEFGPADEFEMDDGA